METDADGALKSYHSDSYGKDTAITVDDETDQLLAAGKRVLPPGAYGKGAYHIQGLEITYDKDTLLFTVKLEVTAPGIPGAGVTIRCLNPAMTAPEGEGGTTP